MLITFLMWSLSSTTLQEHMVVYFSNHFPLQVMNLVVYDYSTLSRFLAYELYQLSCIHLPYILNIIVILIWASYLVKCIGMFNTLLATNMYNMHPPTHTHTHVRGLKMNLWSSSLFVVYFLWPAPQEKIFWIWARKIVVFVSHYYY